MNKNEPSKDEQQKAIREAYDLSDKVNVGTSGHIDHGDNTQEDNEVARFIARIGEIFYSKINAKNLWSKQKIFKAYNASFLQACEEFRNE